MGGALPRSKDSSLSLDEKASSSISEEEEKTSVEIDTRSFLHIDIHVHVVVLCCFALNRSHGFNHVLYIHTTCVYTVLYIVHAYPNMSVHVHVYI